MIQKVLLAMLLCLAAVGCKSSPIAGTWVTSTKTLGFTAITFTNDGTFEASSPAATSPVFSGTWEIKDGRVELSVDHSSGKELDSDSAQTFEGAISQDGKQLAIGSAMFNKR